MVGHALRNSSKCPVQCWDTTTGERRLQLVGTQKQVRSLAFAPDGRSLASGHADRALKLWDMTTGQEVVALRQRTLVEGLAFSPDGNTLALMGGWSVELLDVRTWERRAQLRGHKGRIWSMAFTPDGRTLLTGSNDGTVKLWDVASGRERGAFDWQIGKVYAVAFAPDGMRAAAAGPRNIVIWDVDEG
jgi:WD40 repeat protein